MTQFFGQDFSTERWKKAALKNAFALLSKQRFQHAAAFFLLGGKLWDACEVCISRLSDIQLALVIARLHEGDGGPIYEKILKGIVLGIHDDSQTSVGGKGEESKKLEPHPDCFLRSIAYWLLQDYSNALETLLMRDCTTSLNGVTQTTGSGFLSQSPDPSIFNFYFFLRSQPLLIRRNQHDYRSLGTKSRSLLPPVSPHVPGTNKHAISSVGEEPLTPLERNLLFGTAYHHLNHGCPLLALDVLSKLPKSSSLGADLSQDHRRQQTSSTRDGLQVSGDASPAPKKKLKVVEPTASLTGMIQSGTLRGFDFGGKSETDQRDSVKEEEEEDVDWSQPVSSTQNGVHSASDDLDWSQPVSGRGMSAGRKEEEEEIDWSKPITADMLAGDSTEEGGGEVDWSKPISSHFGMDTRSPSLSPPNFGNNGLDTQSPASDGVQPDGGDGSDYSSSSLHSQTTLSSQGLFILSLAEQLQYNACLSILTEELITIHLPPCCEFLWENGGKESLPVLPLAKREGEKCLAVHYKENPFEKTVLSLRGMLVLWLRREMGIVKEICGFDSSTEELEESSEDYVPAGYDLLTTLMNYASLHAGTTPSLITVKLELMHLMNTMLPWSTEPTRTEQDFEGESVISTASAVPTCAVDPSQLPILTSCSLPAKHLTNLALHLRLMSASIIEVLANHTCPPISSKPLPHVSKVFELCCAISSSITMCLSPINFSEIASTLLSPSTTHRRDTVTTSGVSTPVITRRGEFSQSVDPRHKERASPKTQQRSSIHPRSSGSMSEAHEPPATPNTRASKWPGLAKWPKSLQSDEGKDPTPMSLILAECCIAVYLGLLSIAWSWHSVGDLLLLLKNGPSQEFWYQAFGGGLDMKRSEEKGRRGGGGGERGTFMKKVDTMKKMLRKSVPHHGEVTGMGLFVAPKKTLLDLFLHGAVSEMYYNVSQF